MSETNWMGIMRPLMKDNGVAEQRRRKRFAGFDLPSTSHEWSDEQNYAYKGIRDGLGIDALKAEQYVNKHTDPAKPSGHANLFYPATEPMGAEYDIAKRLFPKMGAIDPDLIWRGPYRPENNRGPQIQTMEIPDVRALDKPPVQFASMSGHTMTDANPIGKPVKAGAGTLPLIKGLSALGKQKENEDLAAQIAQANGLGDRVSTTKNGMSMGAPESVDRFHWSKEANHNWNKDYSSIEDAARGAMGHVQAVHNQFNDKSNSLKPESKHDIYANQPVGGWIIEVGKDDSGNPIYHVDERYSTGVAYGNTGSVIRNKPAGVVGIVVYAPTEHDEPDMSYSTVSELTEGIPVIVERPDGSVEIYTKDGKLTGDSTTKPSAN